MRTILLAGLLLAIVTVGCGGASHRAVRLQVTPATSVEDQPIRIHLDGLRAPAGRLARAALDRRAWGHVRVAGCLRRRRTRRDRRRQREGADGQRLLRRLADGLADLDVGAGCSAVHGLPVGERTKALRALGGLLAAQTIASVTFVRRWSRGTYTTVTNTVAKNGFAGTLSCTRRPTRGGGWPCS